MSMNEGVKPKAKIISRSSCSLLFLGALLMFSALWLGFDAINFSIRESNGMHDANMTAMASLADISGDPRSYYEYRDKHELEKQLLLPKYIGMGILFVFGLLCLCHRSCICSLCGSKVRLKTAIICGSCNSPLNT